MNQAVSLTFSLKYLVNFSKSTSLSRQVQLMMSADVPLLVSPHHGFPISPPVTSSHTAFRSHTSLPKGRSITTSPPRSATTKRRWLDASGPQFPPNLILIPFCGSLISLYFIFYYPPKSLHVSISRLGSLKSICNPIWRIVPVLRTKI